MWAEWKQHPATSEWFDFMANLKEELKSDWEASRFVGETQEVTIQRNAFALGQVDILNRMLQAEVQTVKDTNYDSE